MKELVCFVCNKKFIPTHPNNKKFCTRRCKNLGEARKRNGRPVNGPIKSAPKGSGYITSQGYKLLSRKHPNASKRGQVLEHVLVMSEFLKRPIRGHERIHHINGVRSDNRLENLELWSHSHPYGQRVEDKICWAKEFLSQYGYQVIDPCSS